MEPTTANEVIVLLRGIAVNGMIKPKDAIPLLRTHGRWNEEDDLMKYKNELRKAFYESQQKMAQEFEDELDLVKNKVGGENDGRN